MELERIKVFRMVHIENIPHILQYGITHKRSPNANPNFVSIGDTSLIDTRSSKIVRVDNGDIFNPNAPQITLGNYIPFYFGVKMPMLYVMQTGGNFVERATPPEQVIYLVCLLRNIIDYNYTFYFTDGHATDNLTSFYDSSKIDELSTLVDWTSVKAPYWARQENLNTKRKKQAEFLVMGEIPSSSIYKFGCYNEAAKLKLVEMGVEEDKISINPNAYY
jgi:hypothetical protein